MITLESFDQYKSKARINSPRSLDACRRQGIDPGELLYVPMEEYKQRAKRKNLNRDLFKLRWEHHEQKRKEKLRVLLEVHLTPRVVISLGAETHN